MDRDRSGDECAFGRLTVWFVHALAVLAAANVLAIVLLSEWIATAVSYLPSFVAGLLVVVVGFVVADFIGDAINRTRAATETPYTAAFATGTRMFLYFTAVVIGPSTMGIDVTLPFTVAQTFAWGFAAAIAIDLGGMLASGGQRERSSRAAHSVRSTFGAIVAFGSFCSVVFVNRPSREQRVRILGRR